MSRNKKEVMTCHKKGSLIEQRTHSSVRLSTQTNICNSVRSFLSNCSQIGIPLVFSFFQTTVKILKTGTPEIITIIVLHLEQLDFTVQYCVQKMQTE